jgi:hypothetical protein
VDGVYRVRRRTRREKEIKQPFQKPGEEMATNGNWERDNDNGQKGPKKGTF